MKHGMSRTRTFKSWDSMRQRCTKPNSPDYPRWGGKGVKICDRWMKFENFYADMGERPEGKTLDRHPNKIGNYEPGNCRWATPGEQQLNKGNNRFVTYKGVTKTIVEWVQETGIPYDLLLKRLNAGATEDQLFAPSYSRFPGVRTEGGQLPKRFRAPTTRKVQRYTAHGKTLTITEWAEELNVTRSFLSQRLQKYKMDPEVALTAQPFKRGPGFKCTPK